MYNYDPLIELARKNYGIITTGMVVKEGIRKEKIKEMLDADLILRVSRGVYVLKGSDYDEYKEFQTICSKGIYSYGTAAYFWGLSDRVPNILSCTVPQGFNATQLETDIKVKFHYVKQEIYEMGITQIKSPQGALVYSYDMERTICDLIRSHDKMDVQLFGGALTGYFKRNDKNIRKLVKYGKKMNITTDIERYMEVLQ